MHAAKGAQEIAHTGPETFNRIDMHFAHTIAIIVARPFMLSMRDRCMFALHLGVATPFIGVHIGARTGKGLHVLA